MTREEIRAWLATKGSLPVRGDVDLEAANDCMKKGLEILKKGNIVEGTDQLLSPRRSPLRLCPPPCQYRRDAEVALI